CLTRHPTRRGVCSPQNTAPRMRSAGGSPKNPRAPNPSLRAARQHPPPPCPGPPCATPTSDSPSHGDARTFKARSNEHEVPRSCHSAPCSAAVVCRRLAVAAAGVSRRLGGDRRQHRLAIEKGIAGYGAEEGTPGDLRQVRRLETE